ncbi:hypothetical protein KCP71_00835 [Salmonella enterica subsp. enterica]|nr:hypothetical protein KCP71_00835 [Salmonella enterica subsp. enterica]
MALGLHQRCRRGAAPLAAERPALPIPDLLTQMRATVCKLIVKADSRHSPVRTRQPGLQR